MIDTAVKKEKAIVIGLVNHEQDEDKLREYLDELDFLIDTAGGITLRRFTHHLDKPDARTFVGLGKLAEIRDYVHTAGIDLAVFDDDLSPSQIRNLDEALQCKILDRSNLILDIFARRARTAHAKTQVELAQYQYLLPRLPGLWTHLSKQRGGIGLRGPGEKEIETDRRIIRDKIALLKRKLTLIDIQKTTQRSHREGLVRASLVGYTNVGKSTLMNLLSKSHVFAEDKLFATLDTTVRKVVILNLPFLLSDTVGFIRKLPHDLIESFKSTLDEVREANLILHVVDISHPGFEEQMAIVKQTLIDINAFDKPTIIIFNKIDAYPYVEKEADDLTPPEKYNISLEKLQKTWMAKINVPCVFISATEKTNFEQLKEMLYREVKKIHMKRYPYNNFLY